MPESGSSSARGGQRQGARASFTFLRDPTAADFSQWTFSYRQRSVLAHTASAAADVDDVTALQDLFDGRGCHHLVAVDFYRALNDSSGRNE